MADSTTALGFLALFLLCVIAGLLVYFLSYHKPSEEQCAELYKSNICTQAHCTTAFPCAKAPSPTWKPTFDTATSGFLKKRMKLPTDDIGETINSEIEAFSKIFDSNVCSTLTSLEEVSKNVNPAPYGYDAPAAQGDGEAPSPTFNCMALIKEINKDIASASITNFEKMKLIHLRQAIVDNCNKSQPVGADTSPTGISIESGTSINASEFKKEGAVAKVFCGPK